MKAKPILSEKEVQRLNKAINHPACSAMESLLKRLILHLSCKILDLSQVNLILKQCRSIVEKSDLRELDFHYICEIDSLIKNAENKWCVKLYHEAIVFEELKVLLMMKQRLI